jgi:hypothetical protein
MIPEEFGGRACQESAVYSGGRIFAWHPGGADEPLVAPEILFDFTGRNGGSWNNKPDWR